MKATAVILVLAALCCPAFAAEKPSPEALADTLAKWKLGWNKEDVDALMKLYHPDSRDFLEYKKADEEMMKGMLEGVKLFGSIKTIQIGKFIERKACYVLKIEYEKKGMVPGTMAFKKDSQGNWMIEKFNVDGQREPELKE